jgi:hypothetical protein
MGLNQTNWDILSQQQGKTYLGQSDPSDEEPFKNSLKEIYSDKREIVIFQTESLVPWLSKNN